MHITEIQSVLSAQNCTYIFVIHTTLLCTLVRMHQSQQLLLLQLNFSWIVQLQ